ncbi:hypothetical protein ACHAWF_001408 [Thalassiosira exigua]
MKRTRLREALLAFAFTANTAHAFAPVFHRYIKAVRPLFAEGNGAIKKSYNDDALFNFHMMTQAQKIRDYSAMDTFVETKSIWNLAWHDSFVRNGLSDFVPPLTDTLNVLVVGNSYQGPTDRVVGSDDGVGDTNNMPTDNTASAIKEGGEEAMALTQQDSSCSFLAAVFDDSNSGNRLGEGDGSNDSTALELASYDCIMDQGIMADLCASMDSNVDSSNREEMARLLFEATKRVREMGIYVANTPPMTSATKDYLNSLGEVLGLQWEFDLDGISDKNLSVSVARKFGTCPAVGWQTFSPMLYKRRVLR